MMTMSELLEDKAFREYMLKVPKTYPVSRSEHLSPMWVVYVQKTTDGPWRRKAFRKYKEAFKFMRKAMKLGYHDVAINNKRLDYDPPMRFVRIKGRYIVGSDGVKRQVTKKVPWKPRLPADEEAHQWCRFCRRPVIFKRYSKHHAMPQFGNNISWDVRRCCICGCSERIALNFDERRL